MPHVPPATSHKSRGVEALSVEAMVCIENHANAMTVLYTTITMNTYGVQCTRNRTRTVAAIIKY